MLVYLTSLTVSSGDIKKKLWKWPVNCFFFHPPPSTLNLILFPRNSTNKISWPYQQRTKVTSRRGRFNELQEINQHFLNLLTNIKIAIRGDGKSPDQKVIDMQLQAANLVYIFDVIILSVTANKSGRLTVETSFLPLNSSKGGTLKCKP